MFKNINKKFYLFFVLICITIIFLINVHTNIRRSKFVEAVKITIDSINNQDYEKIKLSRIAPRVGEFYIEKISNNIWQENKSYFKKIRITFPDYVLKNIQKITVNIGKKTFEYSSENFVNKWKIIEQTTKSVNNNIEKYLVYESPDDLKVHNSFLPIVSKIINWPGDFKILFYSFNLALAGHFLIALIVISLFFLYADLLKYKYKSNSDKVYANATYKEKISVSISIASLFSSIFFFSAFQIYFLNIEEFNCTFLKLFPFFLIVFLLMSTVAFLLIMVLYKYKMYKEIISSFFILSLLLWLQGNIFIWKYGIFDGSDIHWNKFLINGIIDSFVWITFIFISLLYAEKIYKHVRIVSIFFILLQLFLFSYYIIKSPEVPGYKKYSIDKSILFNFSPEKNVIVLTLDEFQSDVFNEIINEDDYYKNIFNDFVYFPNCLSAYKSTNGSVPTLLTGTYYDNSIPLQQFIKSQYIKKSLPKFMMDKGFRVDAHPQNSSNILFDKKILSNIIPKSNMDALIDQFSLYDLVLFRCLPHFLKKYIYNDERWLIRRIILKINYIFNNKKFKIINSVQLFKKDSLLVSEDVRFINQMLSEANLSAQKYTFKYYHINGPHPSFVIDENFEPKKMSYNRTNYKKQAKASLKATKMFLDKLKELGIYNKSLILVISDHGSGRSNDMYVNYNGNNDYSDKVLQYNKARGSALMLIKKFNSNGEFKTNEVPISLTDIPKTVATELKFESQFDGYSIFDNNILSNRKRIFYGTKEFIVIGDCRDNSSWH